MSAIIEMNKAKVMTFLTAKKNREPEAGWSRTSLSGAMRRKDVAIEPCDGGIAAVLDSLVEDGKLTRTKPHVSWRYFLV